MDMDNYRAKLKKLCIGEKIADIPSFREVWA